MSTLNFIKLSKEQITTEHFKRVKKKSRSQNYMHEIKF